MVLGVHFGAGQIGGGGAGDQEHLVLVAHDLVDRERDRGGRHVDDHIDLVDVDPGAHDVGSDVRLVLVVGADDLDLHALGGGAEILDRHAGGDHRALAAQVGVGARHVVHHADLDGAVGILRERRRSTRARPRARVRLIRRFMWRTPLRRFRALASSHTPRYSWSFPILASSSELANRSMMRAMLHHVIAVRDRRGEAKVLLDQQDGEALLP